MSSLAKRRQKGTWRQMSERQDQKEPAELTSELSEAELAQSMAGVGVIVQHDKDGELPIVDLGAPHHSEVGQWQCRELIHGHKDIARHLSDPLWCQSR